MRKNQYKSTSYAGSPRAFVDGFLASEEFKGVATSGATPNNSTALGKGAKSPAIQVNKGVEGVYFREVSRDGFLVSAVDVDSGEVIQIDRHKQKTKVDQDSTRADRFRLQAVAGRILKGSRVSKCLRLLQTGQSTVQVLKSSLEGGNCSYSHLQTCGSVWSCPVCAAKISERRRAEVEQALKSHQSASSLFSTAFVTYTFPHCQNDNLKDMLKRLALAMGQMKADRRYKKLKAITHQLGTIRALEVTHGQSGWHPHIHEIWLCQSLADLDKMKAALSELWSIYAQKNGFAQPSEKYGVTVQNGDFAAAYIAKWGHEPTKELWTLDAEIAKASSKKAGRGGRSPFQILDDAANGCKQSAALFAEYSGAFAGQRQLFWSRGLKDHFQIGDLSDEELAAIQEQNQSSVIELTHQQWKLIISLGCRYTVLKLASVGGSEAVLLYLSNLRGARPASCSLVLLGQQYQRPNPRELFSRLPAGYFPHS